MVWVVDDALTMGEEFAAVATQGPVSFLLATVGLLLMAGSIGAFGLLTLGALTSLATPGT